MNNNLVNARANLFIEISDLINHPNFDPKLFKPLGFQDTRINS